MVTLMFFTSAGMEWSTGRSKASLHNTTALSFPMAWPSVRIWLIHWGRKRACAFSVGEEIRLICLA